MPFPFLALLPASLLTDPTTVSVQPWCRDAFRIRVAPSGGGGTELPSSALVADCGPGARAPLAQGGAAQHDNLRVNLGHDGTLTFARVDTGAVLFSAAVSLTPAAGGLAPTFINCS